MVDPLIKAKPKDLEKHLDIWQHVVPLFDDRLAVIWLSTFKKGLSKFGIRSQTAAPGGFCQPPVDNQLLPYLPAEADQDIFPAAAEGGTEGCSEESIKRSACAQRWSQSKSLHSERERERERERGRTKRNPIIACSPLEHMQSLKRSQEVRGCRALFFFWRNLKDPRQSGGF